MSHDVVLRSETSEAAADSVTLPLRLTLLGGFTLSRNGEPVTLPVSAQRLVAFLALHPRPLRRSYVAGSLWPDTSQSRSSANLRSALWRAHQPGCKLVQATVTHLALDDLLGVDATEVAGMARRLLDPSVLCLKDEFDVASLTGELLPDWYEDDWVVVERERLRQLCLHALEALCERLTALGRYGQAVDAGLAAVQGEPLRESAHRALIAVHLAEGNHAEALRQYRWFRQLLADELGLRPSARIVGLMGSLPES